jgi:hypothetical protein
VLAGEQRVWWVPMAIPADRGRLRKGVDMVWNIGTIDKPETQRTELPDERAPKLAESGELVKAASAFEEWLQAYRKRLEETCQRANSRPASPVQNHPSA